MQIASKNANKAENTLNVYVKTNKRKVHYNVIDYGADKLTVSIHKIRIYLYTYNIYINIIT